MFNKIYCIISGVRFSTNTQVIQKRHTSSQKVSQEIIPLLKKEVLDNGSTIKNTTVGHNVVAKQDFSIKPLHPMTPIFNPGLAAHVAAVNAPNTSSSVFDHLQQSNSIQNSYKNSGSIYKNNAYDVSNARLFNVFHENNIPTCFDKSHFLNNVIVTPFNANLKNVPGYVQNPNQARPDVLVDFRQSILRFKGIQSYDHKAIYTKTLPPGKLYTHTIFYGLDKNTYVYTLSAFAEKYKEKHGVVPTEIKEILSELVVSSNDVESQTFIITENLHVFDPALLPPVRTEEFFYTKHCTEKFVSAVKIAENKNNFVSSLLYKNSVPVGVDAKSSKTILYDHKNLLDIINDYGN